MGVAKSSLNGSGGDRWVVDRLLPVTCNLRLRLKVHVMFCTETCHPTESVQEVEVTADNSQHKHATGPALQYKAALYCNLLVTCWHDG